MAQSKPNKYAFMLAVYGSNKLKVVLNRFMLEFENRIKVLFKHGSYIAPVTRFAAS